MAPDRFRIRFRDDDPPEDATVLLHMGEATERAVAQKVENAIRAHDYWIGCIDDHGRFAVSVYALVGIDEATVLSQMRHASFGRSTVGEVRSAGFAMMATSIRPFRLQEHHYSVMLPTPGLMLALLADTGSAIEDVRPAITTDVNNLIELFKPTVPNTVPRQV